MKLCIRTTFSVNHMLKNRLREKSYLFNDLIELGSDRPSEKKDSMSRQQTPKILNFISMQYILVLSPVKLKQMGCPP